MVVAAIRPLKLERMNRYLIHTHNHNHESFNPTRVHLKLGVAQVVGHAEQTSTPQGFI
jgi:hypothetical protein